MKEIVVAEHNASVEAKYNLLNKQIRSLLNSNDEVVSNLANLAAALKQSFEKINWVGFYLFDGEKLILGPFQGKIACTTIELRKGVCGTAAEKSETIIVPDVNKFPGHIFCDADSKSEIVVPILREDKTLFGVLDLDSDEYNSFDGNDKKYLEDICKFLGEEIINKK